VKNLKKRWICGAEFLQHPAHFHPPLFSKHHASFDNKNIPSVNLHRFTPHLLIPLNENPPPAEFPCRQRHID